MGLLPSSKPRVRKSGSCVLNVPSAFENNSIQGIYCDVNEGTLNRVLSVSYNSLSTWLLAAGKDEGAALREAKLDLSREFGSEAVP